VVTPARRCSRNRHDIDELIKHMPRRISDAGIIYGVSGVPRLPTGRGRIVMRARTHFETGEGTARDHRRRAPYQVNKKTLLERIARAGERQEDRGHRARQDESDKSGMRV